MYPERGAIRDGGGDFSSPSSLPPGGQMRSPTFARIPCFLHDLPTLSPGCSMVQPGLDLGSSGDRDSGLASGSSRP